VIEEIY